MLQGGWCRSRSQRLHHYATRCHSPLTRTHLLNEPNHLSQRARRDFQRVHAALVLLAVRLHVAHNPVGGRLGRHARGLRAHTRVHIVCGGGAVKGRAGRAGRAQWWPVLKLVAGACRLYSCGSPPIARTASHQHHSTVHHQQSKQATLVSIAARTHQHRVEERGGDGLLHQLQHILDGQAQRLRRVVGRQLGVVGRLHGWEGTVVELCCVHAINPDAP